MTAFKQTGVRSATSAAGRFSSVARCELNTNLEARVGNS